MEEPRGWGHSCLFKTSGKHMTFNTGLHCEGQGSHLGTQETNIRTSPSSPSGTYLGWVTMCVVAGRADG